MIINESNKLAEGVVNVSDGDYVVYKWRSGGRLSNPEYLNWVHVDYVVKNPLTNKVDSFVGWWEGESLKNDLWISQVVYASKSKNDAINYIKKHTNKRGVVK